jgi:hypothetical protein
LRETPERVGRHVDFVSPRHIDPEIADAIFSEQIGRGAQGLVYPERLDQSRYIHLVCATVIPAKTKGEQPPDRRCRTMRGKILGGMFILVR